MKRLHSTPKLQLMALAAAIALCLATAPAALAQYHYPGTSSNTSPYRDTVHPIRARKPGSPGNQPSHERSHPGGLQGDRACPPHTRCAPHERARNPGASEPDEAIQRQQGVPNGRHGGGYGQAGPEEGYGGGSSQRRVTYGQAGGTYAREGAQPQRNRATNMAESPAKHHVPPRRELGSHPQQFGRSSHGLAQNQFGVGPGSIGPNAHYGHGLNGTNPQQPSGKSTTLTQEGYEAGQTPQQGGVKLGQMNNSLGQSGTTHGHNGRSRYGTPTNQDMTTLNNMDRGSHGSQNGGSNHTPANMGDESDMEAPKQKVGLYKDRNSKTGSKSSGSSLGKIWDDLFGSSKPQTPPKNPHAPQKDTAAGPHNDKGYDPSSPVQKFKTPPSSTTTPDSRMTFGSGSPVSGTGQGVVPVTGDVNGGRGQGGAPSGGSTDRNNATGTVFHPTGTDVHHPPQEYGQLNPNYNGKKGKTDPKLGNNSGGGG